MTVQKVLVALKTLDLFNTFHLQTPSQVRPKTFPNLSGDLEGMMHFFLTCSEQQAQILLNVTKIYVDW